MIGEKVLLKFGAEIRREMTVEQFTKYLQIDEKTQVNKSAACILATADAFDGRLDDIFYLWIDFFIVVNELR